MSVWASFNNRGQVKRSRYYHKICNVYLLWSTLKRLDECAVMYIFISIGFCFVLLCSSVLECSRTELCGHPLTQTSRAVWTFRNDNLINFFFYIHRLHIKTSLNTDNLHVRVNQARDGLFINASYREVFFIFRDWEILGKHDSFLEV